MITGSTHSLHPQFAQALTAYRQALTAESAPVEAPPDASTPVEPPEASNPVEPPTEEAPPLDEYVPPEAEPELNQYDPKDLVKEAADDRRDEAREAAVLVNSIQHQQDMIDVYVQASSDSKDVSHDPNSGVTPASAYDKTLTQARRQDFLNALEHASEGSFGGPEHSIDIIV